MRVRRDPIILFRAADEGDAIPLFVLDVVEIVIRVLVEQSREEEKLSCRACFLGRGDEVR